MPSNSGEGEELFAITGAVLGGCSLRGGEGTVVGMIFGAMVLKVLDPLIVFAEFPDAAQKAIVGLTLLFGTLADEFFRRRATRRG
jgi:ribose transport system permease protein